MRLQSLGLTFLVSLVGACGGTTTDAPAESADDGARGGLGKADLIGSCQGPDEIEFCGGQSDGVCWCDEACVGFGDCCSDVDEVCGIDPPPSEGEPCGGFLGNTCTDDEYCAYQPGQFCGAADASSTCEPRPEACPAIFAPVCGCDGNTYSNSCNAAAAGTGVSLDGECPPVPPGGFCGGIAGIECPDGQVCVDDSSDDCDPDMGGADCAGACELEPEPLFCGGIAGIQCPPGLECIDDPDDGCDTSMGGADCGGICVPGQEPVDSCEDACGGQAESGACWCDDLCSFYGDCCDDIGDHCE